MVYAKGGYVLHMLRSIMNDPTTGDQPFITMMRDFVKTHFNKNASTESFKPGFPFWPWHGHSIHPRRPECHVFSR